MSNSKWAALGAVLLASTSLTTGAIAAEWTATVSGSAEVAIAYVSGQDETVTDDHYEFIFDEDTGEFFSEFVEGSSSDNQNVGLVNDAEVQFKFKLVADNGITFGYHMELENESSAVFDEYNAYVSGSFGTVELGVQDGAYDKLLITPPGCSFGCPGDGDGYLFDHFSNVSAISIDGDGNETSDDLKLTYYTPKFSGFQAGISWIPNGTDGEGTQSTDLTEEEVMAWEFGAQWRGDITEDVDAGVSFAYALGEESSGFNDEDSWSIGAELGLFGGAFGARYTQDNSNGFGDESTLSVGAEYGTGPWGFFVNYAGTIDSDNSNNDGDWALSGEVDYDLAPGVTAYLLAEYGSPTEDDADNEFAIGTGLGLSF